MFRIFMLVCAVAGGNCSTEEITKAPAVFADLATCRQNIAVFEPLVNQEMRKVGSPFRVEMRCREDL